MTACQLAGSGTRVARSPSGPASGAAGNVWGLLTRVSAFGDLYWLRTRRRTGMGSHLRPCSTCVHVVHPGTHPATGVGRPLVTR